MKIPRPVQALVAICSPQLGPTSSAAILSSGTFRSLASSSRTWSDWAVSRPPTWMRREPLPSCWTIASWPEASSAYSCAWLTETSLFGVVKTAPPWNSMPMLRPRTARATMAVMVIRMDRPYQILRLPMKS